MMETARARARAGLDQIRRELLDERNEQGHWTGRLAASALSTATAVSAMSAILIHSKSEHSQANTLRECIRRGLDALSDQQGSDGGFGDTDRSHSNIATSYLVWAASALGHQATGSSITDERLDNLRSYISDAGEFDALRMRYGKDKTFVVPIMTNLAIAGLADWAEIPPLPFEAAVFPQSMYRLLRMPVVSYAIPALVAIGQARHFCGPPSIPPVRWVRAASVSRTMKVLERMQPESGGYLEATPLTSFVVMSLAATGRGEHPVCQQGLRFLIDSMDKDGLWPIDTNLATWVTSLSMHALSCDPDDDGAWCSEQLTRWHVDCQHRERHPFTGAEPGGWGWSDLSGAVPDSDDTPAAILALARTSRWLSDANAERDAHLDLEQRLSEGVRWLRQLQNRDGGWPTFCRGWGKLPFDRSSNDLTAHALRAFDVMRQRTARESSNSSDPAAATPGDSSWSRAELRAAHFLRKHQDEDGSWLPLWFGNQDREDETNPVYGTARVLLVDEALLGREAIDRGCGYLIARQNRDGGWGGGPSVAAWLKLEAGAQETETDSESPGADQIISSVEETALAVDALATVLLRRRNRIDSNGVSSSSQRSKPVDDGPGRSGFRDDHFEGSADRFSAESDRSSAGEPSRELGNGADLPDFAAGGNERLTEAIIRGVEFLVDRIDADQHRVAWPIGFYFAKLWYHERLYPLIFSVTALGKFLRATAEQVEPDWPR